MDGGGRGDAQVPRDCPFDKFRTVTAELFYIIHKRDTYITRVSLHGFVKSKKLSIMQNRHPNLTVLTLLKCSEELLVIKLMCFYKEGFES